MYHVKDMYMPWRLHMLRRREETLLQTSACSGQDRQSGTLGHAGCRGLWTLSRTPAPWPGLGTRSLLRLRCLAPGSGYRPGKRRRRRCAPASPRNALSARCLGQQKTQRPLMDVGMASRRAQQQHRQQDSAARSAAERGDGALHMAIQHADQMDALQW